jgi:hypothetical protein
MIDWLKSLPKTMFVALVLGAGVLFIVLQDPPHGICDARMTAFKAANVGFMDKDPATPLRTRRYERLLDICKQTNNVGGCFELFQKLREMVKAARLTGTECYAKLGNISEFEGILKESLDLMVKIAWGSQPPATPALKTGWLDAADLNLFCELKSLMTDVYGKDAWTGFMEPYFKSLPQANTLPRQETWGRMIFSLNCQAYL